MSHWLTDSFLTICPNTTYLHTPLALYWSWVTSSFRITLITSFGKQSYSIAFVLLRSSLQSVSFLMCSVTKRKENRKQKHPVFSLEQMHIMSHNTYPSYTHIMWYQNVSIWKDFIYCTNLSHYWLGYSLGVLNQSLFYFTFSQWQNSTLLLSASNKIHNLHIHTYTSLISYSYKMRLIWRSILFLDRGWAMWSIWSGMFHTHRRNGRSTVGNIQYSPSHKHECYLRFLRSDDWNIRGVNSHEWHRVHVQWHGGLKGGKKGDIGNDTRFGIYQY